MDPPPPHAHKQRAKHARTTTRRKHTQAWTERKCALSQSWTRLNDGGSRDLNQLIITVALRIEGRLSTNMHDLSGGGWAGAEDRARLLRTRARRAAAGQAGQQRAAAPTTQIQLSPVAPSMHHHYCLWHLLPSYTSEEAS